MAEVIFVGGRQTIWERLSATGSGTGSGGGTWALLAFDPGGQTVLLEALSRKENETKVHVAVGLLSDGRLKTEQGAFRHHRTCRVLLEEECVTGKNRNQ